MLTYSWGKLKKFYFKEYYEINLASKKNKTGNYKVLAKWQNSYRFITQHGHKSIEPPKKKTEKENSIFFLSTTSTKKNVITPFCPIRLETTTLFLHNNPKAAIFATPSRLPYPRPPSRRRWRRRRRKQSIKSHRPPCQMWQGDKCVT